MNLCSTFKRRHHVKGVDWPSGLSVDGDDDGRIDAIGCI